MPSPITRNEGILLPWLQNFALKIPIHGPTLGLSIAQVDSAVADCNMMSYLIQTYVGNVRQYAAAAMEYKDLIKNGPIGTTSGNLPTPVSLPTSPPLVPAGTLPRLRMLIQEIKNKPAYDAGIGADLDILTGTTSENTDPPTIDTTSSIAGNVVLTWSKNGWTGVKIQTRQQSVVQWTDMGIDLFSPFVDVRPLLAANTPEVREYRMCHLDGDTILQNWSSVTIVTVQP